MSKKRLEETVKNFCGFYLDTMDARRAAEQAGTENGHELLSRRDVQRYLERLRKSAGETVKPEDVIRRLCQIAFSRPNDAVALACGQKRGAVAELDLAAVAEFKCKEDSAEVKFLDRVRALQVLGELLGEKETDRDGTARDFLAALEACAGAEGSEEDP